MTEHSRHRHWHQAFAWMLSILLHVLLLLGIRQIPLGQPKKSPRNYGITLTRIHSSPSRKQSPASALPVKKPSTAATIPESFQSTAQPHKGEPNPSEPISPKKTTPSAENTTSSQQTNDSKQVVDKRGLYSPHLHKETPPLLELEGWIWDTTPNPHDYTEETGRIVFEIRVDDTGEVVAIKTLEKTVSPLVEKIYRDALAELTFSRTTTSTTYAPISVGRVTFLLKVR